MTEADDDCESGSQQVRNEFLNNIQRILETCTASESCLGVWACIGSSETGQSLLEGDTVWFWPLDKSFQGGMSVLTY